MQCSRFIYGPFLQVPPSSNTFQSGGCDQCGRIFSSEGLLCFFFFWNCDVCSTAAIYSGVTNCAAKKKKRRETERERERACRTTSIISFTCILIIRNNIHKSIRFCSMFSFLEYWHAWQNLLMHLLMRQCHTESCLTCFLSVHMSLCAQDCCFLLFLCYPDSFYWYIFHDSGRMCAVSKKKGGCGTKECTTHTKKNI